MNVLLDNLLLLLKEETGISEHLLVILQKEKRLMIDLGLEALEENNREKEALLLRIAGLEKERMELMKELSPEGSGAIPDNLTLLSLSKLVGDPYSFSLEDSYNHLNPLLNDIMKANRENMTLLHHSLGNIQESITFLSGFIQENPTYAQTGRFQNQEKNGRRLSGKV